VSSGGWRSYDRHGALLVAALFPEGGVTLDSKWTLLQSSQVLATGWNYPSFGTDSINGSGPGGTDELFGGSIPGGAPTLLASGLYIVNYEEYFGGDGSFPAGDGTFVRIGCYVNNESAQLGPNAKLLAADWNDLNTNWGKPFREVLPFAFFDDTLANVTLGLGVNYDGTDTPTMYFNVYVRKLLAS